MNNEEIRYYLDNIINEINKNFEYYEKTSKKIDEYDQIRSTEKEIFITNYQTKSNLLKDSLESLKKECQQIIEQINLNNYNGEISNEVIKSAKEFKVKYDDFAKYNLGDIYFNYAKSTYDRIEQLIKESYNNIN
ncbi:MAG: hypothetical protein Q4G04_01230, partial [bacterium]|nr:hypothetical protein [bacterium]